MEVAPRLLGRQLAGPDSPRPDGRPQRGGKIVFGRPNGRTGGGGRGGQLADLFHHVLVFALHVFGRFDDQDGVPQVGRKGYGLLFVHGLDEGRNDASLDLAEGPLAGRIEFPEGGDLVAAELDPEGLGMPRRKRIDDTAPVGVLSAEGQQVLPDVAEFGQPLQQAVAFECESAFEPDEQLIKAAGPGERAKQAEKIGQDQSRRTVFEVIEKTGPRRDVLEGGGRSAIGILGQRRKGFDVAGYTQVVQEKPAAFLEFGQGPVGCLYINDPGGRMDGQHGQKIGPGRVIHSRQGEPGPLFPEPLQGADKLLEFRDILEEIKTHRLRQGDDYTPRRALRPCGLRRLELKVDDFLTKIGNNCR